MGHTVTIGGDRLGSGKKMKADLHGFARSTHDLSYIFRSTMAAGTLVPFMVEIGLPGDTFDINLDVDIKTHPTIGPLFGSYKVQADIFEAPVRLYQGKLHNNALNIGMDMSNIFLPRMRLWAANMNGQTIKDLDNFQINPSCILSYLGIRGVGSNDHGALFQRYFSALQLLMYWDVYKNYYANKQEEIGAVIHTPRVPIATTVTNISLDGTTLPQDPGSTTIYVDYNGQCIITFTPDQPELSQIEIRESGAWIPITSVFNFETPGATTWIGYSVQPTQMVIDSWRYIDPNTTPYTTPQVATFPLDNIDDMRNAILAHSVNNTPYTINDLNLPPYNWIAIGTPTGNGDLPYIQSQEGLALKTYQSDLFNNWIRTEWIDGPNGISEVTAIDTSSGSFTIDTLNLSKKVYEMLNRIAISGGSYNDWINAAYDHNRFTNIESPVYHGGLIKELVFQEVVSNSATDVATSGTQPLGTLAGKGVMGKKHKGGRIHIKCSEPSVLMGIISLTPRVDYSQGNMWWSHLTTMDDFHKPNLDEIGFQELITEQMAWWSTQLDAPIVRRSAGKQPAWINYMTNVNKCYGNFAIETNEMFMTLNRRYEPNIGNDYSILDLTTYIDPSKFNHIFAQTSIDAQNFWTQIAVDITARRKMSAKVMPNL